MAHSPRTNRYAQIIERIFLAHYSNGATEVEFRREEIVEAAADLGIPLPKNLGDVVYSFRYRRALPEAINSRAPEGMHWIIRPAGSARYRFVATSGTSKITPAEMLAEAKIPDATPGIISMYALSDEQALLAKLRYNRLIDIFTGVTCYSLQSHLRTQVSGLGQVETDEIYLGIDRRGVHYVFPVQAKGGSDSLSVVQIEQDFALCEAKFAGLTCRAIAAQFIQADLIALFELEQGEVGVAIARERHYRLVPGEAVLPDDLRAYRDRPE